MCYDISPVNKCGYESLWVALKCKKSTIVDTYNLSNMLDLYKLLKYGSEKHHSLFSETDVIRFYQMYPKYVKKELDMYRHRLENTDNGLVPPCYFLLVSIYFNIKLVIVDEMDQVLRESTSIKNIMDTLGLDPTETIKLYYTPNHVEYLPENHELELFNKIKREITEIKLVYEEGVFQKITRDEFMLMLI